MRGLFRPVVILVGVLEGLEVIAYHASIPPLGVGIATVLSNLQVVLVGLAGVFLFQERPRPWFWASIPLTLAGIWLINQGGDTKRPSSVMTWGLIIAVVGALLYAAYLVDLRMVRLRQADLDTTSIMASVTIDTLIPSALAALGLDTAKPAPTVTANVWMIALALRTPVLGWWLLTSSIHKLPASFTSVTLLLQPALALAWGVLLLGEPLDARKTIGGGCALIGIIVAQHANTRGTGTHDQRTPSANKTWT